MSIVICAGVPRAPLVDSHHLHGPVPEAKASSAARGLCYHLQAEQYTMRAANHLDIAAHRPTLRLCDICVTISIAFFALHFSMMNTYSRATLLIMNDIIKREISTNFDRTVRIKKIKSLITNSKVLINYYFSQN